MSKTSALFSEWGQLVVRLDTWYLMRRFASGVTTESHQLHPTFMRQLSHCIFEVDPGDARRLTQAKRHKQQQQKHHQRKAFHQPQKSADRLCSTPAESVAGPKG
ncbi:uncharacterized protein LOC105355048 [Oryzias latipes]